jgi:hypothetical protein
MVLAADDFQDLCSRLQQLESQAGTTPLLTLLWSDPLPPEHISAASSPSPIACPASGATGDNRQTAGAAAAAMLAEGAAAQVDDFEQIPSSSGEGWTLL